MAWDSETAAQAGKKSSRKGTPNKATTEIREKFTALLQENFDTLKTDIAKLDSKDRVQALLMMAKFVLPTLKATEISTDDFQPINIINLGNGIKPD